MLEKALDRDNSCSEIYKAAVTILKDTKNYVKLFQIYDTAIYCVNGDDKIQFSKDRLLMSQLLGVNVNDSVKFKENVIKMKEAYHGKCGLFECNSCNYSCTTKYNLSKHKSYMHAKGHPI